MSGEIDWALCLMSAVAWAIFTRLCLRQWRADLLAYREAARIVHEEMGG